jgi:hypothetical protein
MVHVVWCVCVCVCVCVLTHICTYIHILAYTNFTDFLKGLDQFQIQVKCSPDTLILETFSYMHSFTRHFNMNSI